MSVDPLRRCCVCGYYTHFKKWHYIIMLLFGRYVMYCPNCNRKHVYRLIYHCVEEHSESHVDNRLLAEGKSEVWKKC
ncbi:MAG: hypothetical protein IKF82_00505 [Bacilli bacterium]|nr:hypothetical protein [Bacilli bacterium]